MKSSRWIVLSALFVLGCGGREAVKTQFTTTPASAQVAAAPPTGPQAPALAGLRNPVSDQDYKSAVESIGSAEASVHNIDDYLTVAQYQYNRSNLTEALKTYQKVLLVPNASYQMDKAQYMVGQIYYDKRDYLSSLAAFQSVLQKYPKSNYVGQSRQMMQFILSYSLGLEDLRSYVANYPNSPVNCFALFQLGSREAQAGMNSDAIDQLNAFAQRCPQDPSLAQAQMLLQSLQGQQQGKTWKIGVLAPRTGRFKAFGDSVVNGITLALEQAKTAVGIRKPISVVVRDTAGDSLQAIKQFQALTQDGSLDALIGPVVASELAGVAPLANQQRVALISPTGSRDGISTLGPYLFSNSMTNEMQGRAAAKYAMEKLGLRKFAILAPDDGYGETLADAFQKAVTSAGGSVVYSETYVPNSTDFKKQLIDLGGMDPESLKENDRENVRRMEELKFALKKEAGKALLKGRDNIAAHPGAAPAETPAVAFFPLVEGLTNTACPSIVKEVNDAVREGLKGQTDFILRSDDLVQQAMTRMPPDAKGTTLPVSADQWTDIAQDLGVSMIVTGRVIETNPPNDWSTHPTWDFSIEIEAFQMAFKKNAMVRISLDKVPYAAFRPPSMTRASLDYQALYLPAHAVEIPLLASQIHYYDLKPLFLGGHLWENETVMQEGTKDIEGSYFVTGFYVDSAQGNVKKFVDDYLRRFAMRPDLLAAQSYDAARLLLKATENASGRDDIQRNLLSIKDFDGVSGKTTFGGHGEADKVVPVIKIQNGKYQQVQ
ncbi:MAG TPA: penicillin-binding protein activator [bacterium]|nr:penicillin-binding protein activator [bacterium]